MMMTFLILAFGNLEMSSELFKDMVWFVSAAIAYTSRSYPLHQRQKISNIVIFFHHYTSASVLQKLLLRAGIEEKTCLIGN